MKKKIFLALLAVLGIFGLASCGGNEEDTKKITIKYMGWDSGTDKQPTLMRKLIEEFNATNDEIYIKIVKHTEPYDNYLNQVSTNANAMPDVFLVNSVPNAVANGLALDITNYANADDEWDDIQESLRKSVYYGANKDKVYAIPAGQHYMGYIANLDLLEDYRYNKADFYAGEYTHEEFFTAIETINNVNVTDQSGVVGVNATGDMINWLPSALDTKNEIKHYIWNSEKYEFDFANPATLEAIKQIQNIANKDKKLTFESLFEEVEQGGEKIDKRDLIFGDSNETAVFNSGKMAFLQGATYQKYNESKMGFDYRFIAYPDQKVVVASDYMCISSKCKNPEAAFKVAKFLTYGAAGYEARFKVAEQAVKDKKSEDIFLTGLPINNDTTLTAKWFDYVKFPGLKETYEKVAAGQIEALLELNKSYPGYFDTKFKIESGYLDDANKVMPMTDFMWNVCSGKISFASYQGHVTELWIKGVNDKIKEAEATVNKVVDAA